MELLKYSKRIIGVLILISAFDSAHAQAEDDYEYERSSMHSMMIKHLNQQYGEAIESVFSLIPIPERFNDHDLGVKLVSLPDSRKPRKDIESFIEQVNLGQKCIAKWFNRDKETGSFNMELIKERGHYNASKANINTARQHLRGLSLIEDAGEELIKHTYLVISDITYADKSTKMAKLKFGIKISEAVSTVYKHPFNQKAIKKEISSSATEAIKELNQLGGFKVDITTYLFKLQWNEDIAAQFYNQYYTEDGKAEPEKVEAFKADQTLFKMEYVGQVTNSSKETSFKGVTKPEEFITKVCTRALDENLADLQHSFSDFRIKAPLISTEPLKAYVGLKEDITTDSRFEVLERRIDEQGKISYKRIGVIKPTSDKIWDNRFMAAEEEAVNSELGFTTFQKVSGGDFYPGMLIREIK